MMNGLDADQSFDSSFDAFLNTPSASSPAMHLAAATTSPSASLNHMRLPGGSADAFGLDPSDGMRPSSSEGNLHLNISNLSVNNASEQDLNAAIGPPQQQQQLGGYPSGALSQAAQQRLQSDFMLGGGGATTSSPHSLGASPGSDVLGQTAMPPSPSYQSLAGPSSGSPASKARGLGSTSYLDHSGGMGGAAVKAELGTSPNMAHAGAPVLGGSVAAGGASMAANHNFGANPMKRDASGGSTSAGGGEASSGVGYGQLGMPSTNDADTSLDDSQLLSGQSEAELKRQSSKFVYKLFRMVSDQDCQHLISWNRNGTSVMVCNFDEFAKEVLGKHFKHSNFSSFIRQLNMYGFYKVNKTPRGHRQSADTQVWEFSHPKFLRGRPDLLDDIRRKALDSEHARVEARDLQYSVSVGQMQLRQQVEEMSYRIDDLAEQNAALRSFTTQLRDVLGVVLEHIKQTNGGQVPFDVRVPSLELPSPMPPQGMWTPQIRDNPPIFVTEPEYGGAAQQRPPGSAGSDPMFQGGAGPGAGGIGQDPFAMGGSAAGSRRVSHGSSNGHGPGGDGAMPMRPDFRSASVAEQGMMPPAMPQHSASFEGQMLPPQFPGPRSSFGGKPHLAGLAIDTSAAGPLFPNHQVHQGVSPTSTGGGLMAVSAAYGHASMPPSPLTPGHQAMFAAINTPLPPSPAPNAVNGGQFGPFDPSSPYLHNGGFGQAPPFSAGACSDAGFFGGGIDGEGPNAKAMRTPLKRTASNSGPHRQGTPTLVQQVGMPQHHHHHQQQAQGPIVSPILMKRKSPV